MADDKKAAEEEAARLLGLSPLAPGSNSPLARPGTPAAPIPTPLDIASYPNTAARENMQRGFEAGTESKPLPAAVAPPRPNTETVERTVAKASEPAQSPSRFQVLADPLFNGLAASLIAVADFSVMRFTESLPPWFAVVSFCLCGLGIWVVVARKELSAFKHGMPTLLLLLLATVYMATYGYAVFQRLPPPVPALPSSTTAPAAGSLGFAPVKPPESQIGETFSIELAQTLHDLPQPCLLKITNPANSELGGLVNWVATYGNLPYGPICKVQSNEVLQDADNSYAQPTSQPGLVVHWHSNYAPGQKIAHFFDASGVNTRVSHELDADSPNSLIWFDFGPGSPWKKQ